MDELDPKQIPKHYQVQMQHQLKGEYSTTATAGSRE